MSGVEVRDCETPAVRAVTGTLTAAQAMLIHVGELCQVTSCFDIYV